MTTQQEAMEAIEELNTYLYETHKEEFNRFNFSTDGYCEAILFDDVVLWCSENNEREFNSETGEYEPFLPFLKIQFNKYADKLHKFRFKRI